MGFLDKFKGRAAEVKKKASDLAAEHEGKIDEGIDKAADMASKATKGKYDDRIDGAAGKAKGVVEDLGDEK
ncbi:MAG: antitoxin [Microthrixaceae bacterium]